MGLPGVLGAFQDLGGAWLRQGPPGFVRAALLESLHIQNFLLKVLPLSGNTLLRTDQFHRQGASKAPSSIGLFLLTSGLHPVLNIAHVCFFGTVQNKNSLFSTNHVSQFPTSEVSELTKLSFVGVTRTQSL